MYLFGCRQTRLRPAIGLLVGWCLLVGWLVTGCGLDNSAAAEASNLTVDELPIGLGRGYLLAGLEDRANRNAEAQSGEAAPNFQLQLDDGRHFSLVDLQGRPVLINFWATWCTPCRQEMPDLVKATTTHPQLIVLAVNVQEELDQIQAFAEEFQMTMPIVRDAEGDLRQAYGVKGMPTSIFIDEEGKIVTVWSGVLTPELLQKFLDEID